MQDKKLLQIGEVAKIFHVSIFVLNEVNYFLQVYHL